MISVIMKSKYTKSSVISVIMKSKYTKSSVISVIMKSKYTKSSDTCSSRAYPAISHCSHLLLKM